MPIYKKIYLILCVCILHSWANAEEIKINWKIKNGSCQDCIAFPQEDQGNFDFAVHNDRLFLSDYEGSQIKVFDKNNKNVKTIKLAANPQIITFFAGKLFVLLRNNSLNIYNDDLDSISAIQIKRPFSTVEYTCSFFIDSLLVIELTKGSTTTKFNAQIINILNPQSSDTIIELFDFLKFVDIPVGGGFAHRPSNLVDICGANGNYLVLARFVSKKTYKSSGYILFNRKNKTLKLLDSIPEKYGIPTSSYIGKEIKICNDRIYFLTEIIGEKDNAIFVGSYPLKSD